MISGKSFFKAVAAAIPIALAALLCACGNAEVRENTEAGGDTVAEEKMTAEITDRVPGSEETAVERDMEKLRMNVDGKAVRVEWENNESVSALAELAANAPVTVTASAYGGFEQVGPLGSSLPRNDVQITTSPGDIVLYSGDQIVLFHGSNRWAYTRLGRIVGMTEDELNSLLGKDSVVITVSVEK